MSRTYFIDSHCHLQDEKFKHDCADIILEAAEANVKKILVPGIDLETSRRAVEIAREHEGVYAAVGVHPHEAAKTDRDYLDELKEMLSEPKVVAVGEIGLDYYYDFSPKETQIKIFEEQIQLALEMGKPLIIHTRESVADSFSSLHNTDGWKAGGVFHCFPGALEEAEFVISRGMLVSYPGLVTFKKAEDVRRRVKALPLESLLLETDSPYMTPEPYRGKRNKPAHIPLIAEKIAEIKSVSIEEVARITTESFNQVFLKTN